MQGWVQAGGQLCLALLELLTELSHFSSSAFHSYSASQKNKIPFFYLE